MSFSLKWTPSALLPVRSTKLALNSSLPDIFAALQEQLGLKLIPQRVSTETLVIDRVSRKPTEN